MANGSNQTTDETAKDAAAQKSGPLTEAEKLANGERLMDASFKRQKDRRAAEDKAVAGKAAKIATILATVKALAPRHICDGLSIWTHISCADHSAAIRPNNQDEFRAVLFEMAHRGQLAILGGNLDSPLNAIHVRSQEFRID
jgi:hypothetical protein